MLVNSISCRQCRNLDHKDCYSVSYKASLRLADSPGALSRPWQRSWQLPLQPSQGQPSYLQPPARLSGGPLGPSCTPPYKTRTSPAPEGTQPAQAGPQFHIYQGFISKFPPSVEAAQLSHCFAPRRKHVMWTSMYATLETSRIGRADQGAFKSGLAFRRILAFCWVSTL